MTSSRRWRVKSKVRWARALLFRKGKRERDEWAQLIRRSDLFNETYYLQTNPDVILGGFDPWHHFLQYGLTEGRDPHPRFDTRYYTEANADVAGSGLPALIHYLQMGQQEGRRTVPVQLAAESDASNNAR